ncbi:TetR/AcrR family transcriptional regulator [Thiorhodococcus mannitoliphagus]|uniref:TetR/AcrR family transcriptional regulator n=1 Tax=Thiorhodococcus mannitoliphagus TaxID=329406 RepID=A0A6P1E0F9_9GAMM|nr:TetR/AcrR family transcriptional regulator [Thiorhodococcus mannitoliphagus]NEX21255.1 TetR/AcrR family transcriptional regulator [Thiorhodococcus mannitoliphagus]
MTAFSEQQTAPSPPRSGRGRPRSEAKRAAIMQAAARLFLEQGPQAISMDRVAAVAGVSKRTVYAHFGSKEGLFEACTRWQSRTRRLEGALLQVDEDARTALFRTIRRLMQLVLDPAVIAMCRVVQYEATEHPEVAAQFFENGPRQSHAVIVALLEALRARGDLRIDELDTAAWQLINLSFGTFRMRLMLNLIDCVPEAELDAHLRRTTDDFLRLYGAFG